MISSDSTKSNEEDSDLFLDAIQPQDTNEEITSEEEVIPTIQPSEVTAPEQAVTQTPYPELEPLVGEEFIQEDEVKVNPVKSQELFELAMDTFGPTEEVAKTYEEQVAEREAKLATLLPYEKRIEESKSQYFESFNDDELNRLIQSKQREETFGESLGRTVSQMAGGIGETAGVVGEVIGGMETPFLEKFGKGDINEALFNYEQYTGFPIATKLDEFLKSTTREALTKGVAPLLRNISQTFEPPVNAIPSTDTLFKPKPGDWSLFGIDLEDAIQSGIGQIPRLGTGLTAMAFGTAAGTAIAGPPGAIVGSIAAPTILTAAEVVGEIAKERARNNGRETPNEDDLNVALLAGTAYGAADTLALKLFPGAGKAARGFLFDSVREILTEGGTEGFQELVSQLGKTTGTEAGTQIDMEAIGNQTLIGVIASIVPTAVGGGVQAKFGKTETETDRKGGKTLADIYDVLSDRSPQSKVFTAMRDLGETRVTGNIELDIQEQKLRDDIEKNKKAGIPTTAQETVLSQIQSERNRPVQTGQTSEQILEDEKDTLALDDTQRTPAKIDEGQTLGLLAVLDGTAGWSTKNKLRKAGLLRRIEGYDVITDEARLALGENAKNVPTTKSQLETISNRFNIDTNELSGYSNQELAGTIRIIESQISGFNDNAKAKINQNILNPYKQELLKRSSKSESSKAGNRSVVDEYALLGSVDLIPTTGNESRYAKGDRTAKGVKVVYNAVNKGISSGKEVAYTDLKNNKSYTVSGINQRTGKISVTDENGKQLNFSASKIMSGEGRIEVLSKNARKLTSQEIQTVKDKYNQRRRTAKAPATPAAAVPVTTPTTTVQPEKEILITAPIPKEGEIEAAVTTTEAGVTTTEDKIREKAFENIGNFETFWRDKLEGASIGITEDNDSIKLNKIVIPSNERNKGQGTAFMNDLIRYADSKGKQIRLTPSIDFGGTSVSRLKEFYKRFGFVENKGKNKDFEISDTMYRNPKEVTPIPTEETPPAIPTEATTPPPVPTEPAVAPTEAQETPPTETTIVAEEEARKANRIKDAIAKSREARKKNPLDIKSENEGKRIIISHSVRPEDIIGKNIREVLRYISEANLGDSKEINDFQDIAASMLAEDIEIFDIIKIKKRQKSDRAQFVQDPLLKREAQIEVSSNINTPLGTLLHEIGHAITTFEVSKAIRREPGKSGSDYLAKINEAINSDKTKEPVKRLLKLYVDTIEQLGLTKEYFGNKKGLAGTYKADTSKNRALSLQKEGKLKSKVGELDDSVFYGLANIEEFVAQTFNSDKFRGLLSRLKAPESKKSIYRAIVDAIKNIIGLPTDSMAFAVIDTTFDIGYINAYPIGLVNPKVAPLVNFVRENGKLSQVPSNLSPTYLRTMFSGAGIAPSDMADLAFKEGLIEENSTDALFTKINQEMDANDTYIDELEESKERKDSIKSKALSKEPSENKVQLPVNELNYGDEVSVDGNKLSVATKNTDTNKVMLINEEMGDRIELNSNDTIQVDKDSYSKTPPAPKDKPLIYNEMDTQSEFSDVDIDIQPTIVDRLAVLGETITNFFTGKGKARGKYEKGIKFLGRGNRSPEVQAAIERIAGGENAIAKELKFILNRLTKLSGDLKTPLSNIFQAIGDIDYNLTKEQYNNLSFAETEARKQFEIEQIRRIKGDAVANRISKLSNTDRENWIADRNNINREDAIKLSQESELAGIEARNDLSKKFISQNYEEAIRTKRSLRNELPEEILNEVSSIEANLSKVLGDAYKDGILPNRFKPRQNADAITLERYYKIKGDKAYAKKYRENPRYMEKLVSAIESLTIDARTKRYLERGVPQEGSTEPRMVTRAEAKRLAQADLEADPNFSNGVALKLLNEAVNNPTDALNRMLLDDIGMTQRDLRFGTPAILNEILGKAVNEPTNNFINILLTAGTNQVFYDNFSDLKQIGLEKGWLIPPGALEETPQGYVKVKANDIKAPGFSQLFGGYMVPQEFFDAMSEVYNPNVVNALTKTALRYNSLAMRAATSLNLPGGPNRNFLGNVPFMIASGNLSLSKLGSAFKSTIANLRKMTDKQRQDYLVRAAKYGITDDNITSLIADYERISSNKTKMDYITEGLLGGNTKLLRKFGDVTNDLYQSVDNFWKFALWESEKDIVREAEPQRDGESDQDFQDRVDRTAADRVSSSLPSFARMIDLGRIYRKPGIASVVGSFIGFRAELIRLSYAGPMQAFADIKSGNPTYVKAGWRRVAGLATVYSMFPAMAAVLKSLFDISDEEEEAARSTLPPWEANANLLFWRDDNGKINYFNTSFMNPFAENTDWIRAFGREWDRKSETNKVDALVSATALSLKEIAGPILELQIGTAAINEVYNNMSDNGRQVYNPEDSDMKKLSDISGHLLSSVIPTSIRKGQALGRSIQGIPERTGEVLSTPTAALNFLFAKTGTIEPEKSTRFTAFEINRRLRDAARLVTSTARSKGQVSDSELIAAYDRANESYTQIMREANKFYNGQLALGLTRQKADALMREANLSANIIKQIKNGYITPYQISEQTLKEIPKDRRNVLSKQIKLQPKKISLKDD